MTKKINCWNAAHTEKEKKAATPNTEVWPDNNTVGSASQAVHFLNGDLIHFIVDLEKHNFDETKIKENMLKKQT